MHQSMLCRLSYTQISSQQHGAPQEAKVTAIRGTFNTSQASIVRNIQLGAWSSTLFQLLPRKSQISLATISQDELRKLQQDIDRERTSTEARELAAFRRIHIPDQGIGISLWQVAVIYSNLSAWIRQSRTHRRIRTPWLPPRPDGELVVTELRKLHCRESRTLFTPSGLILLWTQSKIPTAASTL
jgi:hypothetical protein